MTRGTVLITGCSSGIGYAAAHGLRNRGWQVFAACRQDRDCARLRAEGFASPRIDYTDPASIETGLAQVLDSAHGRLDALFHNGAHAIPGAAEDLPADALRAIFDANVFGWHDLTRRVIPVMRAQGEAPAGGASQDPNQAPNHGTNHGTHQGTGRIIYHSSVLGLVAIPWRSAYTATKFATEALADTLRLEMRDTRIHVITLNTGPVTSKIRVNAIPHFERWIDWRASPRRAQYESRLLKRLYEDRGPDPFELPPRAVTRKLIHALESPRPKPRYYITTPSYLMGAARRLLSTRALDRLLVRGG